MDEQITREMARKQHLTELMKYFKEPCQVAWTEEGISKVVQLYDIACKADPEDPIDWIQQFDRSHPHNIEVGNEEGRLGKMLVMAEIYQTQNQKQKKGNLGIRQSYREF